MEGAVNSEAVGVMVRTVWVLTVATLVVGPAMVAFARKATTCRLGVCADVSWEWFDWNGDVTDQRAHGDHWVEAPIITFDDVEDPGTGELQVDGAIVDTCTFTDNTPPTECGTSSPWFGEGCFIGSATTNLYVSATDTAFSPGC